MVIWRFIVSVAAIILHFSADGGDSKKIHSQLPANLYVLPVPVLGKERLKLIQHTETTKPLEVCG